MTAYRPRLAFYGDDFTGATDALATAARMGWRSLLFLGIPTPEQLLRAGPLDCLGIAGATRAMAPGAMRQVLEPVARFFNELRPQLVHYKVCSTFDSAPSAGNIAVAMAILGADARHDGQWHAIVGGQPSLGRYCIFSQLYAVADAEVYRIDRHPTMSRHPVTPMHEADMRLHLATLGAGRVAAVDYRLYSRGDAAIRQELNAMTAADPPDAVLFDVAEAGHLAAIGRVLVDEAAQRRLLVVGASSVIESLGTCWHASDGTPPSVDGVGPARGPVLLLAGSLSPVTARQLAAARSYRKIRLDPLSLVSGDQAYIQSTIATISNALRDGEHVLAWMDNLQGEQTAGVQGMDLARAGGRLLDQVLRTVRVGRLGVAGGDSSSLAMQALDAWGLSFLSRMEPGVAFCRLHSDLAALDGLEVMLKGGQMGSEYLFEAFVHGNRK